MVEMVKITVNGKEIEAQKGGLLIDSLFKENIDIPHFCYHPALGKDGNCRMCMVEIEGSKRPQIACDTPVKDGMIVRTKGDKIEQVRKDILELELINHPVDCPICDQAGECKLQDYYMESGFYSSRMDVPKNHAKKRVDLGKNVMLDQERCVLCTRCVRFTEKITGTNELGVESRADHSVITTFPGRELESNYSMNIVDLCPVGALTNKDFRFNQRVWFMESFEAICSGCSRGCNINVDHRKEKYKDDKIFRFRPVVNLDVNGYFICDDGRLSYKQENENRVHNSTIDSSEKSLKEISEAVAQKIDANKGKTLFFVSPMLSNEELTFLKDYASKVGAEISGYSPQYIDESFADDMLRTADRSPNRAGMREISISEDEKTFENSLNKASLIVIFENNYFDDKLDLLKGKEVVSCFSNISKTLEVSQTVIAIASFLEKNGSYTNSSNKTQKIVSGMKKNYPNKDLISLFSNIDTKI